MKQNRFIQRVRGLTVVEIIITMMLISIIAYIGTRLTINFNEQFEWGQSVSNVSFTAVNALDYIENELIQASASSIVLSDQQLQGYKTIDFPKVTGYDVSSKTATIDITNTVRFTLENGVLNKYILDKTTTPPTVVNGPIPVANNVESFSVERISTNLYNISITVEKTYPDGQTVKSTYNRQIYARNR
ncbi:MAG: hypothetical protein ACK4NF_02695 [Planctomycetota bacterium]